MATPHWGSVCRCTVSPDTGAGSTPSRVSAVRLAMAKLAMLVGQAPLTVLLTLVIAAAFLWGARSPTIPFILGIGQEVATASFTVVTIVRSPEDGRFARALVASAAAAAPECSVVVTGTARALTPLLSKQLRALGAAVRLVEREQELLLPALAATMPAPLMLVHPRSLIRGPLATPLFMAGAEAAAAIAGVPTKEDLSDAAWLLLTTANGQPRTPRLSRLGIDTILSQDAVCFVDHPTWNSRALEACLIVHFSATGPSPPWIWWQRHGAWLGMPGPEWGYAAILLWLDTERQALVELTRLGIHDPQILAWRNDRRQHKLCADAEQQSAGHFAAPLHQQQFSVVIGTYSPSRIGRLENLVFSLATNVQVWHIYVIWHNPLDRDRAKEWQASWPAQVGNRTTVIFAAEDTLNNRFAPIPGLQTEALFICDDDIEVTAQDLTFMFATWQHNKDALVGPYSRTYDTLPDGSRRYGFFGAGYSFVLTKALFMHTRFLFLYTCLLPAEVHRLVDEFINCEDLAINMLFSAGAGRGPLHACARLQDRGNTDEALSARAGHKPARTHCLNQLAALFWSGAATNLYILPQMEYDAIPHDPQTFDARCAPSDSL